MDITTEILQTVAGQIEALLIEQAEGIAYSANKLPDGVKLSITVHLLPMIDQVSVDYQLSYALEPEPEPATKQTVKKHQEIKMPAGWGVADVEYYMGGKRIAPQPAGEEMT